MDRVLINVATQHEVHKPGQYVNGAVHVHSPHGIEVDSIVVRLLGSATVSFTNEDHYSFGQKRTIVDMAKELWRYRSLNSMLDLNMDENANNEGPCGRLFGDPSYEFVFRLPNDAATSFQCTGSPVTIKYTIEVSLLYQGTPVAFHEHRLAVLRPECAMMNKTTKESTHSKHYRFPKDRDVFLECTLDRTVFTTTDRVNAKISVANRWKRSLKYVHMSIVRKITVSGNLVDDEDIHSEHTVHIDTTGVGLPPEKPKIPVGEAFTFHPVYNVPALPPTASVENIMRSEYFLKVSIGRAHNFILATLKIPITIVSEFVEAKPKINGTCAIEDQLIDFSIPTVPDLLA